MQRGSLDDLRALVAVARERSFTRAAAKLGVSQSALSQTIRQLETRLGVRLLTRTTRSVSPTQAGERLLRTVRPRFEEIDAELAAVSELAREAGRRHSDHRHRASRPKRSLCRNSRKLLRGYPDIKVEIAIDYGLTDIVASVLTRACERRTGGEGHDRRAHWAGHAHGGGRRAIVFQKKARAEQAAGSGRSQLHQSAPDLAWRPLSRGSSKRARVT